MDQMWRKTKLQGLVWLFVGIDAKFKEKNEKNEKKNSYWRQTRDASGVSTTLSWKGFWDFQKPP